MSLTLSYGFGWGLVINENQQKKLSKYFVDHIATLHKDHPFKQSVWYTLNAKELELFDALEEFYENSLQIESTNNGEQCILILSKHSVLHDYGSGFMSVKNDQHESSSESFKNNLIPLQAEEKLIEILAQQIGVTPTWHVFASI
jgi:hypothetical protein